MEINVLGREAIGEGLVFGICVVKETISKSERKYFLLIPLKKAE